MALNRSFLQQVEYGIAVRMAILSLAMSSGDHPDDRSDNAGETSEA